MIGETILHYRIVEKIGEGGMGEVYRATDSRLKRDVALKVLPAALAADPDRLARFQREAEAVAGLSHPHIVHMYSVEEADGVHFLTMELVEGQGLDQILTPDGLPQPKVLEIGVAIADALSTAHEKGIVHRDLKPANVMISTDGRVKVLDFGLAKLAEETAGPAPSATAALPLTGEGTVLGTVPYMSPEQLRGKAVDHRSDIFSLGVLLYELATGRRPFGGTTNSDITSSILRDTPSLLTQIKPDLPRHLGRIVAHCLEKEPERRLQSVKDVRNELRGLQREVESGISQAGGPVSETPDSEPSETRTATGGRGKGLWLGLGGAAVVIAVLAFILGRGGQAPEQDVTVSPPYGGAETTTPVPESNSIAVLPFVNMSDDAGNEYFSDGISEELLNLLAKIPQLMVTSRSSAFFYKGKDIKVADVARELNVAHILEGSVRKAGTQVRITAQLIEAGSDKHLWSESYDRTLDDIFAIQDEIAVKVVEELKVVLLGELPKVKESNPEAYTLYLQARHLGGLRTVEGYEKAIELYQQALALDSDYADAWDGLGGTYENYAGSMSGPMVEETRRLSREATNRALAIDPDHARAHSSLGWSAMYYGGDLAAAARHFERALSLAPSDPSVISNTAALAGNLGRTHEALALKEWVAVRDPLRITSHSNLGISYTAAGRPDEAIASYRTGLTLSPGASWAHYGIGRALLQKGEPEAALEAMQQEPSEFWRLVGLIMAHHALGRQAESDAALDELIEEHEQEGAYNIAYVLAYRGEADRAFDWLDKAVEYHDPGLSEVVEEASFTNIHADPRWHPFLQSIGRTPEQLAAIEFTVTLPQ